MPTNPPPAIHSSATSAQVYERAIANVPPAAEKRYWQRYIYLWVKYALFEELDAGAKGSCWTEVAGEGRVAGA